MHPTQKLDAAAQFFFSWASYGYNPATQTKAEGRTLNALDLAGAESIAREALISFKWEIDPDTDSSSFTNKRPHWRLWQCLAFDHTGKVVDSLHAIDFGPDGGPYVGGYRRVVEAELAREYVSTVLSEAEAM